MSTTKAGRAIRIVLTQSLIALGTLGLFAIATGHAADAHTTARFTGAKVNRGTASHAIRAGRSELTHSDDFVVPDTPDPHWQVVDSRGNTYLLQRLAVKGDKVNKTITVPAYVPDIATVQIWCAYAETLLGEASFPAPVK
jgi:hypothetical protein